MNFTELGEFLKRPDLDRDELLIDEDEGIVRVAYQGEIVFSDEVINFVHAFFAFYGLSSDVVQILRIPDER